jgi:hypothetical protein
MDAEFLIVILREPLPAHRIEKLELAGVALVLEVDGIIAGEAGVAESFFFAVEVSVHALVA